MDDVIQAGQIVQTEPLFELTDEAIEYLASRPRQFASEDGHNG